VGFCATVFADSLGRIRYVTVAPNGDVYASIEGTRPAPQGQTVKPPKGAFVALRDADGDGRADDVQYVGARGNTGIVVHGNYLYADEGERIVRYPMTAGQMVPAGSPEVIVTGMPLNPGHRSRNFAIAGDGSMYVNVGSATNSCQVKDRTLESPGVDPCAELETRAGIWKFSSTTPNQAFSASTRYATGARNSTGMGFASNGQLYAMTHGRDQFKENWPRVYADSLYGTHNPAEKLLRVNQGDDFGWPYCYYSTEKKMLVTSPEYGGDGTKTDRCAGKESPAAVFPAHWAPLDLHFYTGTSFPAKYRNGAFITFHGSWNRAPGMQAGGKIVFQPFVNGSPSGPYEIFADGFAGVPPAEIQPSRAKHRPVGLGVAPDGSMYVADDTGGRIYRIFYRGC
jgi:glucose/arabinose dehydrogenase